MQKDWFISNGETKSNKLILSKSSELKSLLSLQRNHSSLGEQFSLQLLVQLKGQINQIQDCINALLDGLSSLPSAHIGINIPWMKIVHLDVSVKNLWGLSEQSGMGTESKLGCWIKPKFIVHKVPVLFHSSAQSSFLELLQKSIQVFKSQILSWPFFNYFRGSDSVWILS